MFEDAFSLKNTLKLYWRFLEDNFGFLQSRNHFIANFHDDMNNQI